MLESFYPSGSPYKNSTLPALRPQADSDKKIALAPAPVNSQPRLAGRDGVSTLVEAPDSSGNSSCRPFRFY